MWRALCQHWNSGMWCTTSHARAVPMFTWAKLVDSSLHVWKNTKAPSGDSMKFPNSPYIAWRPATHWIRKERPSWGKGPPSIRAILPRHGSLPPQVSITAELSIPATELYATMGGDECKRIPQLVRKFNASAERHTHHQPLSPMFMLT